MDFLEGTQAQIILAIGMHALSKYKNPRTKLNNLCKVNLLSIFTTYFKSKAKFKSIAARLILTQVPIIMP